MIVLGRRKASIRVLKWSKTYWKKPDSTASGCAVLFQKPGAA
jgi:hypothetical protein